MFLKSHGFLFDVLEAARKASKNKAKQSDVHFEIGEVLRNAPNMPGGSNFVKVCIAKNVYVLSVIYII